VSFSGICRGREGSETFAALTLEHYPGRRRLKIARHAETAMSRWPLTGLTWSSRRPHRPRRKYRAGADGIAAPRRRRFQAAEFLMDYLKATRRSGARGKCGRNQLGRCGIMATTLPPRAGGQNLMARRAKPAAKRGRAAFEIPKRSPPANLLTLLDFVRYAVSRFIEADWCSRMAPPIRWPGCVSRQRNIASSSDQFEMFATARVTSAGSQKIFDVIGRRISTRKPAAYLVNRSTCAACPSMWTSARS